MLSDRFKTMYRQLGLSRLQAAQLLHVSERTLHNWDTGHHEIPYSAYKLLRLLSFSELPGKAWDGWHIAVGQLWSPEGYGFKPTDANWWSNLCRRAELFHVLYKENQQLRQALAVAAAADRASHAPHEAEAAKTAATGSDVPVTRHFSPNNDTDLKKTQQPRGFAQSCHNVKFRFLKIKGTDLMAKGAK
jgi:DNA-binding XRE family transcriptional regulator